VAAEVSVFEAIASSKCALPFVPFESNPPNPQPATIIKEGLIMTAHGGIMEMQAFNVQSRLLGPNQ
jgi:hypothetical protein